MKTYTVNVKNEDRDSIAREIESTLNGLWDTIITIYKRDGIHSQFLNQLVRHFIFLEKSMQYMAVDCKLEIFCEKNLEYNEDLYKLPKKFLVRPTDKNERMIVDTITNRILKCTKKSFNDLAKINAINFSLIKNIYQDYDSSDFIKTYDIFDRNEMKYRHLKLIYKNDQNCLVSLDDVEFKKMDITDFNDITKNKKGNK